MHDSQVVNLFIYSVHIQKEAEVVQTRSQIDSAKIIASTELKPDKVTFTEFEFLIQCVLRFSSVEGSGINSELKQLLSKVFEYRIAQAFELGFYVAFPLQKFIFLLGQDVYLDKVIKSGEEPQSFKQICPAEWGLHLDAKQVTTFVLFSGNFLFFFILLSLLFLLLSANLIQC